ncbi:MAG: hypothetical protein IJ746_06145 [Ruminococcus sp.]|nr:hypothetical protein [Ruminococcus sp.]
MLWYEEAANSLNTSKTYSYHSLVGELMRLKPDMSSGTYSWIVSNMVKSGMIVKKGYDEYALPDEKELSVYEPVYSETALELGERIIKRFPYVQFTVFETVLMNEFLNHMIAQNTVFLQVEKESSIFVFRELQEAGLSGVMYKPKEKDFNLYRVKDSIIVTDLISEAPMRTDRPHCIMLEKMLVDMCADKLIASTFSKAELPDVFEQAQCSYKLDKAKMLRYARRRSRADEIKKYLE